MFYFFAAALGAILGSFINALSFRLGTGRSVLRGRSRCMRCNARLRARDLVPLLSYALARGKCRYCHSRVSLQYPAVEAAAALLALLVFFNHRELPAFGFWLLTWMALLFIVVYDIRHKIIPTSASLLILGLALAFVILNPQSSILNLAAGPLLALPLFLISLLSRGKAMGFGDGVLEVGLGWLLGLSAGLTALMLAFWSGALVGIALIVWARSLPAGRQVTMKSEVPLAPFLVLGAAAAYFFHVDFFPSLPLLFW